MQKVVIVTGAAGVLGGAIASAFGNAGDKVVISDINITPKAEELASAINRGKGEAFVRKTDIRDWEEVDGMVKETVKKWGRLDVIASVGGQSLGRLSKEGKDKLLLEHTVEDWDLVMETNLRGNFNCIKAAAGQMIQQKDGQIIIMGSGTANKGRVGASSYAAAKSGLYGLMRSADLELGG
ncbi:MAG: SDR family NAD(P)-dependent oxidoreductase, partial [Dehalococcoidia bacterium]|nr:SDR family NAD(P)-dependent oxidoreductase [Dehalococcoidia bacterium]